MKALRLRTGLSQRAFADVVRTSGPTVAAYESGAKEPRLSTMQRLAERVDVRIAIAAEPLDPGEQVRLRRRRRSRALAAAMADAVERDYPRAVRLAEANLRRMGGVVGDNAGRRWLDAWRAALDDGPEAVRSALLGSGDEGDDMRAMNPFAGLLDDDARRAVLAAADALS